MAKTKKRELGDWGEEQASLFLTKQGYEIVERNFEVPKLGEIDIIAWHEKPYFGRTLCFIEVKTRENDDGSAERATQEHKLPALFRAAKAYCISHEINMDRMPIQFEQVSVHIDPVDRTAVCKHYVIPVD
jgi:putative endonuclease